MYYLRKYWHLVAGLICIIALGILYLTSASAPAEVTRTELLAGAENNEAETGESEEAYAQANLIPEIPAASYIQVHIAGEVQNPGVYTLPYGARVNDLLELAGGETEHADLTRVNLAAFLQDAQQVIIPAEGDEDFAIGEAGAGFAPAPAAVEDTRVNINTADERELMTLPGVGQVIAGNIIAHRESIGVFSSVEQLRDVPRIGEITMDRLRALVRVE